MNSATHKQPNAPADKIKLKLALILLEKYKIIIPIINGISNPKIRTNIKSAMALLSKNCNVLINTPFWSPILMKNKTTKSHTIRANKSPTKILISIFILEYWKHSLFIKSKVKIIVAIDNTAAEIVPIITPGHNGINWTIP